MGTLDNGAFGHLKGKVGNLVSYTLNGKNVVRELGETTKPPTRPKLANYQKMACKRFLKTYSAFHQTGLCICSTGD